MSKWKDIITEYEDITGIAYNDFTDKNWLSIDIQTLLKYTDSSSHYNPQTAEFLRSILPEHEQELYWIMVSDNLNSINLSYKDMDSLINAVCLISDCSYNLYYSPASYTDWRLDCNARHVRTIFIDIDDVQGMDFSGMNGEQLASWLTDTYRLPQELLPDWCVTSGHGLHLYYLVDELNLHREDDSAKRRLYTDYLITYFGADKACRNKSRILRIPYSYNIKHKEAKTALYRLNTSARRDIERLDFFKKSPEEIEAYMDKCQEERNRKSRETRERNKAARQSENGSGKTAAVKNVPKPSKKARTDKTKSDKEEPASAAGNTGKQRPANPAPVGPPVLKESLFYYTQFTGSARNWNIIKDLNNFYYRHHGDIEGRRNNFFLIMAVHLKRVMSLDEALDFIDRFTTPDFEEEALYTVRKVYANPTKYRYRNVTIAEILQFTPLDIEQSYSNFSEERQAEARKRHSDAPAKNLPRNANSNGTGM
ncbi:MAG: hypothetical protein LUC60_04465 [Lachnospiraceae bacterium]|nr:hypothetical protein [Lachnospiraceae bacterium]